MDTPSQEALLLAKEELIALIGAEIRPARRHILSRAEFANLIAAQVVAYLARRAWELDLISQRALVTDILSVLLTPGSAKAANRRNPHRHAVMAAIPQVLPTVMHELGIFASSEAPGSNLEARLRGLVPRLLEGCRIQLNTAEQDLLIAALLAEISGFGPLDELLQDDTIDKIMVNGPKQIYVERRGRNELTDSTFRDEAHLLSVCPKITSQAGTQIDASQSLFINTLPDGSHIKIMVSPLAIDGPAVLIKKLNNKTVTLDTMAANGQVSPAMATVLKIASRSRLNILISGFPNSGKTTLLSALTRMIDSGERTVTIEEAPELRVYQPHVLRLQTSGTITISELLRTALALESGRVLLGECHGAEAPQIFRRYAGAMGTIIARSPEDAIFELERMSGLEGPRMGRPQLASIVDLICHVELMADGKRRVTRVTELLGAANEKFEFQDLFRYEKSSEDNRGAWTGTPQTGRRVRPAFLPRAADYG